MIDILTTVFLILHFAILALAIYGLFRNKAIAKYRRTLINEVGEASRFDIEHRRDWTWRYKVYNSVDYDEMMIKFWKPLDSFYPDMSFTNMHGKEKK